MKKLIWLLVLVLVASIGVFTCTKQGSVPNYYMDSAGQKVEITNPEEQCVLYRVLGVNTEPYRVGLFLANYAALKGKVYTPKQALAEVGKIKTSVKEETATVGSVITTILITAASANKVGAPEIIVVTEGIGAYQEDSTPIDECTRYKLLAHIAKQEVLINSFGE